MKVLVTGATGLLGVPLVARLRADHTVTVLSRNVTRAREKLKDVEVIQAELEAPGKWWDAVAQTDAIVHLAGESIAAKRWDARQKQLIRDSRVETTRALVEAIAKGSACKVLVSASGIDYYPFAAGPAEFDDDEVTEADPPGESFLARVCRDWEAEARAADKHGVRVVAMRTGLVVGPGGAQDRMRGGPIGGGRQWMSWIHRDDAVAAYAAALTDARYVGPINLVTGSVRNADFMRTLGRQSWLPVPAFALRAAVGELSESILNGRNAVPKRLQELGFTWKYRELAAALKAA